MQLIKIIGIIIIVLNVVGLCFLLYLAGMMLRNHFFSKKQIMAVEKENRPAIANYDIVADDKDLLKDIDLSDLDTLNLDDLK